MKTHVLLLALLMGVAGGTQATYSEAQEAPIQPAAGKAPGPVVPGFSGYDVISVKPNKGASNNMSVRTDEAMFRAENVTVKMLLINAYTVRMESIVGLPSWGESAHFDVNAKIVAPDPTLKNRKLSDEQANAEYHAKVQSILKERFQLKAHLETREMPVYDLVVGKGGVKFKPTTAAEKEQGGALMNTGQLDATGVPLSGFAYMISGEAGRTVVDKTGLMDKYDLKLRWTPDDQANADNGSADKPPSFTTALEEQLGLKLLPAKGPVQTLVVDSIALPLPD